MSDTLFLPLKGEYFDQIKSGEKTEEYRLFNDFWRKRIVGKDYKWITFTRGYPKRDDDSRRLTIPYQGYAVKHITHPHFGPEPIEVFAIRAVNT